jgi:hypothetical protein
MTQSEQILQSCKQAIDQMRTQLSAANWQPPPDPNAAATFDRFVRVLAFFEAMVGCLDPALIPHGLGLRLPGTLQQLNAAFSSFLKNAGQWQNVNNAMDQAIAAIQPIPFAVASAAGDQFLASLHDFINQRDQAIKRAEEQVSAMAERVKVAEAAATAAEARLKEVQGQLAQEKARLDRLIPDFQERANKAQADEQTRFSDAEKQRSSVASAAEAKREVEFKTKLDALAVRFEETRSSSEKTYEELLASHRNSAKKSLDQIEAQLEDAKRIVGLIANTGMAGNYEKVANREWKWMWITRWVAIAFFAVAIAAVAWLIWLVHSAQIDWEMVVFRFALVVVALAPAAYLARESGRHMRHEAHNRRIAMELSALQPFVARLPVEKAQAIVEKKADVYFGGEAPPADDEKNLLRGISLRGDQVLKIFIRVLDAVRGK